MTSVATDPAAVGTTLPALTIEATPTFVVATALATRDFQDVHHDRDLAQAKGVSTDYWDWQGRHTHIPEGALRKVLTALGEDVSSDVATQASLARARVAPWQRTLPATVVARLGHPCRVLVHVPHGRAVQVQALLEGGEVQPLVQVEHNVAPVEVDGVLVGEAAFEVPADLPLGYHRLMADVEGELSPSLAATRAAAGSAETMRSIAASSCAACTTSSRAART